MKREFPFQASLSLRPEIVEQVLEGQSVEVNGRKLKGPGAVFRKAAIMEISAVVFGAFSNTESTAYSDSNVKYNFELTNLKENVMETKEIVLTIEKFKADHADLFAQIMAAGEKVQTERFARLQQACGDDTELLVACFTEGLDTGDAMAKRIEKLSAKNTELAKQIESQDMSHQSKTKVNPATSEFNNQPKSQNQAAEKFDEQSATDAQLKEHYSKTKELQDKFSCADAYVISVRHPLK
jgi:hypothetical protein